MSDILDDILDGKTASAQPRRKGQITREEVDELLSSEHAPTVKSLFNTVKWAEGGEPDLIVGGKQRFDPSGDHPNIVGLTTAAGPSTAAGDYQITGSNWYGTNGRPGLKQRLGATKFDADTQMRAAIMLFGDRDGGAGIEALKRGDLDAAREILKKDWTSVPGSRIGGGGQKKLEVWQKKLNENLGTQKGREDALDSLLFGNASNEPDTLDNLIDTPDQPAATEPAPSQPDALAVLDSQKITLQQKLNSNLPTREKRNVKRQLDLLDIHIRDEKARRTSPAWQTEAGAGTIEHPTGIVQTPSAPTKENLPSAEFLPTTEPGEVPTFDSTTVDPNANSYLNQVTASSQMRQKPTTNRSGQITTPQNGFGTGDPTPEQLAEANRLADRSAPTADDYNQELASYKQKISQPVEAPKVDETFVDEQTDIDSLRQPATQIGQSNFAATPPKRETLPADYANFLEARQVDDSQEVRNEYSDLLKNSPESFQPIPQIQNVAGKANQPAPQPSLPANGKIPVVNQTAPQIQSATTLAPGTFDNAQKEIVGNVSFNKIYRKKPTAEEVFQDFTKQNYGKDALPALNAYSSITGENLGALENRSGLQADIDAYWNPKTGEYNADVPSPVYDKIKRVVEAFEKNGEQGIREILPKLEGKSENPNEAELLAGAKADDEVYAQTRSELEEQNRRLYKPTTWEQIKDSVYGGINPVGGATDQAKRLYNEFVNGGATPSVSHEEVAQEVKRRQSLALSPEEIESAEQSGENLQNTTGGSLAGGFFGSGAGATYKTLAGIVRPFASVSQTGENLYNKLSKIGSTLELMGETSKGENWTGTAANFVGRLPVDLSRLYAFSRLPGGSVIGFGADAALQSAGSGQSLGEIQKAGTKGAAIGALFPVSSVAGKAIGGANSAVETVARLGTIGVGTTGIELASGTPLNEAVQSGIMNALFDAVPHVGAKLKGKIGRIWSKGEPHDVSIDGQGNVSLVRSKSEANPNRVDFEMILDPTDGVYKASETAKNVAPTEAKVNRPDSKITLTPESKPAEQPQTVKGEIGETAPPKELAAKNPQRIESAHPDAIKEVTANPRAAKISEILATGETIKIEDLQKQTRYSRENVEDAVMSLYGARMVEMLPDGSVRRIASEIAPEAQKTLLEKASERYTAPSEPIKLEKSSIENEIEPATEIKKQFAAPPPKPIVGSRISTAVQGKGGRKETKTGTVTKIKERANLSNRLMVEFEDGTKSFVSEKNAAVKISEHLPASQKYENKIEKVDKLSTKDDIPSNASKTTKFTHIEADTSKKAENVPASKENVEAKPEREFSTTQVDFSESDAQEVQAIGNKLINDDDVIEREDKTHATVNFGLHTNDVADVRPILENEKPFVVTLGKVSIFPAKDGQDFDVVKVDVDSPEIHRLNKKIGDNTKVTQTQPKFVPHVTLAKVKAGTGEKYVGDASLEGKKITFDAITFSDKNRNKVSIPLSGKSADTATRENKSKETLGGNLADASSKNGLTSNPKPSVPSSNVAENLIEQNPQQVKIEKPVAKVIYATRPTTAKTLSVFTERGTKASIEPKVIDTSDLLTSLDEGYPQELQPRDRSRAASKAQISEIASKLNPEFLGDSAKASDGRPLVIPVKMPDGATKYAVISGNGRSEGIKGAYESGKADDYAKFVKAKDAESTHVQPVYVGVLDANEVKDLPEFAKEANESATAQMSATEQAKSDAERLDADVLNLFVPSDDGTIHGAANRDFTRAFLQKTVPTSEQGKLVDADGKLNQDGVNRVRNAIFAKAFGETDAGLAAITRMSESTDNNVKNITNALLAKAGALAALKQAANTGTRYKDFDIASDFGAAMEKYADLKEAGTSVDEYIQQGNLFGVETTPLQTRVIQVFDKNNRSGKAIRSIINNYLSAVEAIGNPNQQNLFGDNNKPSAESVFEGAVRAYEKSITAEPAEQFGLFNQNQGRENQSKPRFQSNEDAQETRTSAEQNDQSGQNRIDSPLYSKSNNSLIDSFPVAALPDALPRDPSIQDVYEVFRKEIQGQPIKTPIGLTFTANPGHFFTLIARKPNASRKGFVEGFESSADVLTAIEQGTVKSSDISGYEPVRARNVRVVKDILSSPHLVTLKNADGKTKIVFSKKYDLPGNSYTMAVGFNLDDKRLALISIHPKENLNNLKDQKVIYVSDDVVKALPQGLQSKANSIPKSQTDYSVISITEYPNVSDFVNDLPPKAQGKQSDKSKILHTDLIKAVEADFDVESLKRASIRPNGQMNEESFALIARAHQTAFKQPEIDIWQGAYLNPQNTRLIRKELENILGEPQNPESNFNAKRLLQEFDAAIDKTHGDMVQIAASENAPNGLKEGWQEETAHQFDYRDGDNHKISTRIFPADEVGREAMENLGAGAYQGGSEALLAKEVGAKIRRDDAETELGISAEKVAHLRKLQVKAFRAAGKSKADLVRIAKEIKYAGENRPSRNGTQGIDGRNDGGGTDAVHQGIRASRGGIGKNGRYAKLLPAARNAQETIENRRNQNLTKFQNRFLEKQFGNNSELTAAAKDEILYARAAPQNLTGIARALDFSKNVALDVISIPKSLKASVDISAAGRQGLILSVAHPRIALKAFFKQMESFSERRFEKFKFNLNLHPLIDVAEDSGLYLSTLSNNGTLGARDEAFMSRLLADDPLFTNYPKIEKGRKFIISPVAASERAYVTYLDSIRMDTFAQQAQVINEFNTRKGNTVAALGKDAYNDFVGEQMKGLASFINNATGRGGLGKLEDAAPYFNAGFFSIRYLTSRLQLLNPAYYAKLPAGVRGMAVKNMVAYVGAFAGALALLKLAGGDVGYDDPQNPNMFKVSFGDFHYDFGAGLIQPIRYLARVATAAADPKTRGTKELDLTKKFIRSKLAPVPGSAVSLYTGKNFIGEKVTIAGEAQSLVTPMIFEDIPKAFDAEGTKGTLKLIPAVFGIGVSIYKGKGKGKDAEASPEQKTSRLEKLKEKRAKAQTDKARQNYDILIEKIESEK